jgi:urea transport system ATP-binding protein
MLELEALEVRYGPVRAVRGVSLNVDRGEIVGLVGPNGAGKSTTLLSVMGAIRPAGGDIRLAERSIVGFSPERIVRAGLALVPEGRHIFGDLTVEENLRLGLLGRAESNGAHEDLEWVQGLFPVVHEFRARRAGELSGGQQQQLAIARALVARPRLLVLDEPTEGIQPSIIKEIGRVIAMLAARGDMAILLVEQYFEFARDIANAYAVMQRGEIVLSGRKADMDETAVRSYLTV